ncbi:unnamed protein product [Brassica oleracea var. botrytis]|uniref:Uncharacterized protein n=2 Tax=Brassica TaxID=3705 RepID=A0A3P6CKG6_BRAOL|nr:unnamed protein product [Brassica napus]CAF1885005.1 unnamed protein product [Brassica napus]CAF1885124.1 unnamed protein product [Brassica napus]VDD19247.1 unnamed protein product [Brassica oleracea]
MPPHVLNVDPIFSCLLVILFPLVDSKISYASNESESKKYWKFNMKLKNIYRHIQSLGLPYVPLTQLIKKILLTKLSTYSPTSLYHDHFHE